MSGASRGTYAEERAPEAVAELTGLHGAFSFPEHLLQRIWSRGDFDQRALRTRDGRALKLRRRGRWNRLAGPDFAEAEIELGDGERREVARGAIEVHLRATDWDAHGHASDQAYDAVVLHVVLFPSMREWTEGAGGRRIPILELLPLLERDLEAYAEEAAVEGIAGRPYSQLREALAGVASETLRAEIAAHADRRWAAKVRLAGARIAAAGWEAACHRTALEVLGYRMNREPMLEIAERWPLAEWRTGRGAELAEAAWRAMEGGWARGGVRPANLPRARLAQYARWVEAAPDWPEKLATLGAGWCGGDGEAGVATVEVGVEEADVLSVAAGIGFALDLRARRKELALVDARRRLAQEICASSLGGSRLDTWICDGVLPLLAARASDGAGEGGLRARWLAWAPGDAPEELTRLAREFQVAVAKGGTLSQGELQGLLGWLASLSAGNGRGT